MLQKAAKILSAITTFLIPQFSLQQGAETQACGPNEVHRALESGPQVSSGVWKFGGREGQGQYCHPSMLPKSQAPHKAGWSQAMAVSLHGQVGAGLCPLPLHSWFGLAHAPLSQWVQTIPPFLLPSQVGVRPHPLQLCS